LLALLLGAFDQHGSTLGVLLSNLLGFHRAAVLCAKAQVRDGNVVQDEPELCCALVEVIAVCEQGSRSVRHGIASHVSLFPLTLLPWRTGSAG
jgi:hypothetical protein